MSEELKPCPFCGPGTLDQGEWLNNYGDMQYTIRCRRCEAFRAGNCKDEVVAAWNRRPVTEAAPGGLSENDLSADELGALAASDTPCGGQFGPAQCDSFRDHRDMKILAALIRRLLTPAATRLPRRIAR